MLNSETQSSVESDCDEFLGGGRVRGCGSACDGLSARCRVGFWGASVDVIPHTRKQTIINIF